MALTAEDLEELIIQKDEEDGEDSCLYDPDFNYLVFVLPLVMVIAMIYFGVQDAMAKEPVVQELSQGTLNVPGDSVPAPAPAAPRPIPPCPAPPAPALWPSNEEMDTIVGGIIKVMHAYHDISKPHPMPIQESENPFERVPRKIKEDRKIRESENPYTQGL